MKLPDGIRRPRRLEFSVELDFRHGPFYRWPSTWKIDRGRGRVLRWLGAGMILRLFWRPA